MAAKTAIMFSYLLLMEIKSRKCLRGELLKVEIRMTELDKTMSLLHPGIPTILRKH